MPNVTTLGAVALGAVGVVVTLFGASITDDAEAIVPEIEDIRVTGPLPSVAVVSWRYETPDGQKVHRYSRVVVREH